MYSRIVADLFQCMQHVHTYIHMYVHAQCVCTYIQTHKGVIIATKDVRMSHKPTLHTYVHLYVHT